MNEYSDTMLEAAQPKAGGATAQAKGIVFRKPDATDGMPIHKLVKACPPLDPNSVYCNLLQCHHFAETAVVAERSGEIEAFVTGYLVPENPEVYFVWQMAVSEQVRGQGVAGRMLESVLSRPNMKGVRFIHTTINPSNIASQTIFTRLAKSLGADISSEPIFTCQEHFDGEHETEMLYTIGPFNAHQSNPS